MKVLCVAGQIDPWVFSERVGERFGEVEAVLCAGGLPPEYIDFLSFSLKKPVFFAASGDFVARGVKAEPLAFRALRADIGGKTLLLAGAAGLPGDGEGKYTDRRMALRLLGLAPRLLVNKIRYGRYLDVFLSNAPPRGINDFDDRPGFPCYRRFLGRFKPRFHVHGHVHVFDSKTPRISAYKDTQVVNACGYQVIEL